MSYEKENESGEMTLSAEDFQKFQKASAELKGKEVAVQWMMAHSDVYFPCEANSKLLSDYVNSNGLPWTLDSLDIAWLAVKKQAVPQKRREPEPEEETASLDPLADAPLPRDWDPSIPLNTRRDVRLLDASTYRQFYHSPKSGDAFRRRVNLIQQRGL